MIRPLSIAAAPLAWLAAAATLLAQADPLSVVPDDTLGIVVIKNIAEANQRVHGPTETMKRPLPELLPLAKSFAGVGPGLDENGGIAAAAFADGNDEFGRALLYFVPVTDFKEFIASLQPADADVAITEITLAGGKIPGGQERQLRGPSPPQKSRDRLEKVLASSRNVTKTLEPLKDWMAQQHVALAVTPTGKTLLFKKIAALLSDSTEKADDDKRQEKEDNEAAQPLLEMLKLVKALITRADRELTHLAVGVRIDESTALHVAARLIVEPKGDLAAVAENGQAPCREPASRIARRKVRRGICRSSRATQPGTGRTLEPIHRIGLQQLGMNDETRKKFDESMSRQRATQISSRGMLGPIGRAIQSSPRRCPSKG